MEPEMNENFGQPYGSQSQPGSSPQPEQESTGQQNGLQQTFLNLKLSTWIKCVVISIILSVAAVFIAPEFSTAQSGQPGQTVQPSQQETFNSYCEYEEDMYDYSQYDEGWNDDYSEYQEDSSYDYEDNWSDDYGYESQNDWEDSWSEDSWSDDYETEDDWSYETEDNWSDDYETEEDWSYDYESEDDWSDDYEDDYEYQENTYEYDYYYDD
ncbi:MAG: hypothetical protein FVQ84_09515 [Planctomycetes bacterium]|nr:hypothetical protein [Planctomycetota bacterium]